MSCGECQEPGTWSITCCGPSTLIRSWIRRKGGTPSQAPRYGMQVSQKTASSTAPQVPTLLAVAQCPMWLSVGLLPTTLCACCKARGHQDTTWRLRLPGELEIEVVLLVTPVMSTQLRESIITDYYIKAGKTFLVFCILLYFPPLSSYAPFLICLRTSLWSSEQ